MGNLLKGRAAPTRRGAAERRCTAYHEAGHALAAMAWGGNLERLSIVPNKATFGRFTRRNTGLSAFLSSPRAPIWIRRSELLGSVRVSLAGYAAEEVLRSETSEEIRETFGGFLDWELAADAQHDLAIVVADLAKAYPTIGSDPMIVRLKRQYAIVRAYLSAHRAALDAIAGALLRKRVLQRDEIHEALPADCLRIQPWCVRGLPSGRLHARVCRLQRERGISYNDAHKLAFELWPRTYPESW